MLNRLYLTIAGTILLFALGVLAGANNIPDPQACEPEVFVRTLAICQKC